MSQCASLEWERERNYRRRGVPEEEEWPCLVFHVSGSQSNDTFWNILEERKLFVVWQIPLGGSAFMKPNSHYFHISTVESANSAPCLLDEFFFFFFFGGWVLGSQFAFHLLAKLNFRFLGQQPIAGMSSLSRLKRRKWQWQSWWQRWLMRFVLH